MPMGEQQVSQRLGEVALELAAVVGEDGLDGEGKDGLDQAEELGGSGAGMAAGGPRPSVSVVPMKASAIGKIL